MFKKGLCNNCKKGQRQNSQRFSIAPVQTRGAGTGNKRVGGSRSAMHVKKLATLQGIVQAM